MTRLKTLRNIPPGGWIFEQKMPNGTIRKITSMGPFGGAVKQIQEVRAANGIQPQDMDSIAMELEQQTVQRLGEDSKYCDSKKKALLSRLSELPTHVSRAVKRAAEAGDGARILVDWVGEGARPVPEILAQARANVCLHAGPNGSPCPNNIESHGVALLTDKIAVAILEQRRRKTDIGLKVQGEDALFTCQVCTCHLPLKVWVPMDSIVRHLRPEKIERFPNFCWMKTETTKPTTT